MKKDLVLFGLILCVGGLVNQTTAQTSQTKKNQTSQPASPESNKTRTRRTATTTLPEQPKTLVVAEPKPENSPESTAKPEEPKPSNSPAPNVDATQDPTTPAKTEPATTAVVSTQAPSVIVDPVAALREKVGAASTDAERIQLRLKIAELFVAEGKKTEALTELQSITETDIFDPVSFYNAGNALARLGESEGSIKAYRKAIEQRRGNYSRALNNLGVVLLRLGRWDESHEMFSKALKLENFRYPEASYNLGRLYSARGQSDLAAREWRRVLAMNPEHAGAKAALGRVRTEDRVVVEPPYSDSARVISDRSTSPERTVSPAGSEKPAELKSPSTSTRGPNAKSLLLDQASYDFLQRARTSVDRGNALEAINDYKKVISRQGGYFAPANLELSFAFLSLKRYDEALSNLLLVANRDGARFPISYFHLARVYEIKGELPQAQIAFTKAVKAFGMDNPQFLLDVSRVREKQGDFKGAFESMEAYIGLMKQIGQEPEWSEERLTALKQKAAAASALPKP